MAIAPLAISALAGQSAHATWSIIIVDTRTKEIAIGSATCLTMFDLKRGASVVIPEVGAAAAQSYVDGTGRNRLTIFQQLKLGTDPYDILDILEGQDTGHQTRQYGIVDTQGRAATFTGTQDGQWAGGLTGQDGTLVYSIQGNVLTGEPVVTAAEQAILGTDGDLAEKLMAAMEAARFYGGDGRCSCSNADPEGCGSPPESFNKSAHIGYMIVTRPGDIDGGCSQETGCAVGDYYMEFNLANQRSDAPDPVYQLRDLLTAFRVEETGRPDAMRSSAVIEIPTLVVGSDLRSRLTFHLLDWQGNPVSRPIAELKVEIPDDGDYPVTTVGPVQDLGGGQYSVELTSTGRIGADTFWITVDDGIRPVRLAPYPVITAIMPADTLTLVAPAPGYSGQVNELCASGGTAGQTVTFAFSRNLGLTNTPCGQILLASPVIAGQGLVQSDGSVCISGVVPNAARGETVHFQAVERGTCKRSNLVTWKFTSQN